MSEQGERDVEAAARASVPEEDLEPTPEQVEARARLLPEERAAGSDDPRGQAEAILEESLERTEDPEAGIRPGVNPEPESP